MDAAYDQRVRRARRKNRSTGALTLAPLTTRLPLDDDDYDAYPEASAAAYVPSRTYLQGRSAPTTPGLFASSPSRSRSDERPPAPGAAGRLPKSRSATHLSRRGAAGTLSPPTGRRRREDEARRGDGDWLLRAGALLTAEARETKGQAWLATRDSSTSLTELDEEAEAGAREREAARERERAGRRGSLPGDGVWSPTGGSRIASRSGSRSGSRVGSRTHLSALTPRHEPEGYFDGAHEDGGGGDGGGIPGPDFVNLDERLEAVAVGQDTSAEDEDHVRMLVKREKDNFGSWVGSFVGWPLSSVQENDEETSDDARDGDGGAAEQAGEPPARRPSVAWQLEGDREAPRPAVPPPSADEGGWKDAAWLLSVATRVII